ncbi:MAG: lamin tail domain-containing protein, partial [Verrucomicrobiota bacterium]
MIRITTALSCFFLLFTSVGFTADVIISEFLAVNNTILADEDGDFEDWIELHNVASTNIDLAGWSLTDDAGSPRKWVFPGVTIPAQGFLLVFASNKDRRNPASELHANFRLSGGGEYLALSEPDQTIAFAFAPEYPPQQTDFSYGILANISLTTIVDEPAPARAFIPAFDIGTNWLDPAFDDSAWSNGFTGVGYDTGTQYDPLFDIDLETVMRNVNGSAYIRVPFVVNTGVTVVSMSLEMRFDDGFVAYVNGHRIAATNHPASPTWNSTATSNFPDGQGQQLNPFTVTNAPSIIQPGTNMLAIHGLNRTTDSSDFLIVPRLHLFLSITNSGGQERYFNLPTPNAINGNDFLGFVDDTTFSVDRGFFDAPFSVDITCDTPASTMIYTLD